MKIVVINHTNVTYSIILDARYIDLKHNANDRIEIHVNTEPVIPSGYRLHKPLIREVISDALRTNSAVLGEDEMEKGYF